jgi:hypothetical protein
MNNIDKLNRILEIITVQYHKNKDLIKEGKPVQKGLYMTEGYNETWFDNEVKSIVREKKNICMSELLQSSSIINTTLTTIGVDLPDSDIITNQEDNITLNNRLNRLEEYSDIKKEPEQISSLIKHVDYVKDFSKKTGYVAGTFLTNHLLASIGLPPTALLKPLIIGGVKIGWFATSSIVNYCAANPAVTTAVVGTNLPIIYTYVEKGIKKLNTEGEAPVNPTTDQTAPVVPSVDQPIVESHSLWEFFGLISSITWKVLKKIQDLL